MFYVKNLGLNLCLYSYVLEAFDEISRFLPQTKFTRLMGSLLFCTLLKIKLEWGSYVVGPSS